MEISGAFDSIWLDLTGGASILWLSLVGIIVLVWDIFRNNAPPIPWVSAIAVLIALAYELTKVIEPTSTAFFSLIQTGGVASFISVIILFSALGSILLCAPYLKGIGRSYGEIYALMLFATSGMILLGTANNMVTVFVGLETMSIALYILTGVVRSDEGALESALKYFLLGAFATGFFLYGIALIYGATETMYFSGLAAGYSVTDLRPLFWVGVALFLVGFMFKVGAVPFHMWTPDVYQGAPTPLTGFMATASKAAAFAALILVLYHGIGALELGGADWQLAIAIIALLTVVIGNILALTQDNVKRMLAYSSIAHAGYVLIALVAGTNEAYAGAVYYLLIYALMNIGAFGAISLLEWDGKEGRSQTLDSLSGIGFKRPLIGITMAIFMFSLTGFPPLGGFFGKLAVFAPAVNAGFTWLALVGIAASVFSGYYYLRVLYVFWMKPASEADPIVQSSSFPIPRSSSIVLVTCAILLLGIGLIPGVRDLTLSFFI
ncbi:MAG: NADH-quinone oxidoreductase subunit N [Bacteroidetes bacterium]|nr:NADH-quinone oxidoreductase subunit N [Bacteroidota bacterium]MCY4233043.1 NADH-quinone oxidoreductase subunit N [Bacteroidota bacterium]